MRHLKKKGRKFGRRRKERRSLLRNLMFELIMRERITTTEARAKEIKPAVERLVTIAKKANLASRRALAERLPARAVKKIGTLAVSRLNSRAGGYLRIVKLGRRTSDSSPQAIIEFVK